MFDSSGNVNTIPNIPFFSVGIGYPTSSSVSNGYNTRQDKYQEIIAFDNTFNSLNYEWKYGNNLEFQHSTDTYLQLIGSIEMIKERSNGRLPFLMSDMPNFNIPVVTYLSLICTIDYAVASYDYHYAIISSDNTYTQSTLEVAAQSISASKGYYELKDTIYSQYSSYTELYNDYTQNDNISEQFYRLGEKYALQRRSYEDDSTKILLDNAFGGGGSVDIRTALEARISEVAPSQGDYVYMLLGR